jgi:tRNA (guanine-N7-)-methyltransferase
MVILDPKKNIRSFGRINGRGASKINGDFLQGKLGKYLVKFDDIVDFNKIMNNDLQNYFEIGFGYGESIAERAKNTPNINFIGCETYTKGIANLLDLIEKYNLKNIRIFNGDARLLLENISNNTIDKMFILFPDPWPKKKQNKRRIINEDFLKLVSGKIKTGGELFFASDIEDYIEWTLEIAKKYKGFSLLEEQLTPPDWWIVTKYQEKAIGEGRAARFLKIIF